MQNKLFGVLCRHHTLIHQHLHAVAEKRFGFGHADGAEDGAGGEIVGAGDGDDAGERNTVVAVAEGGAGGFAGEAGAADFGP